jgi:hypothetical protein
MADSLLRDARKHLAEAMEQQTATAEVLRIIRASPSKLEQVLEVVVRSAARFCGANDVTIFELDGHELRAVAHSGPIPQPIGLRMPCTRGSVGGRTVIECKRDSAAGRVRPRSPVPICWIAEKRLSDAHCANVTARRCTAKSAPNAPRYHLAVAQVARRWRKCRVFMAEPCYFTFVFPARMQARVSKASCRSARTRAIALGARRTGSRARRRIQGRAVSARGLRALHRITSSALAAGVRDWAHTIASSVPSAADSCKTRGAEFSLSA